MNDSWELEIELKKEIELSHKRLFNDNAILIGKIHWYIQKAETEYIKRAWKKKEKVGDGEYPYERTEFYDEVDKNEIKWWLFKNNTNITELKEKTEASLVHIQNLKNNLYEYRATFPSKKISKYSSFIDSLNDFIKENNDDIQAFYQYIKWLNSKDVLAPLILWSDLWGTSRRNQRRIKIEADDINNDNQLLMGCTERALGVNWFYSYEHYSDYALIHSFHYYQMNTTYFSEYDIDSMKCLVVQTTTGNVLNEFFEYIEHLRDSVRQVIDYINRYENQQAYVLKLINSKPFWIKVVKSLMVEPSENQLFDFKTTLSYWECSEPKAKEKVGVDFCIQVGGLANSHGGIIIIGISDKRPRKIFGLNQIEEKVKSVSSLINKYVNEPNFVKVIPFDIEDCGEQKTCIILLIPQTKRVISIKNQTENSWFCYPLRTGSGLDKVDIDLIEKNKESIVGNNYNYIFELYNKCVRG